jgi:hypothetical protein
MKRWSLLSSKNLARKFTKVYNKGLFFGKESLSGRGSDADQTRVIKNELPGILDKLNIKTLLDLPCGDLNWMSQVDLGNVSYTGADIVPELIDDLEIRFKDTGKKFICLDSSKDPIVSAYDAIFCRDLLVHLSTKHIADVLTNFQESKSTFLITTHFSDDRPYKNLRPLSLGVGWRAINFRLAPFNFPEPLLELNEGCTEGDGEFRDKSLAVWRLSDLPNLGSAIAKD